jgi:MFS family permease
MDGRASIGTRDRTRLYHGWLVVAAAFLIAMYGFGLGFYGLGIYLVALDARNGWSTAELSSAITAYYILGAALLFFYVGPLFDRWGARTVVMIGTGALACGVILLTQAARLWQIYGAFAVTSVGWATMSGAAINIIVVPWFDRRRGLAVSWSLNGASAGGVVIVPVLTFMIARFGLAIAVEAVAGSMLAILIPIAALILRPRHPSEHDHPDAASATDRSTQPPNEAPPLAPRFHLAAVLRSIRFVTTSVPFALGFTAQVGFLTHQIAFLSPVIGTVPAGWAVSLTTFAAVVGRIATGFVVARLDRRVVACVNFAVQALAMGILTTSTTAPAMLYLGCGLFGLGVGNATSLPGLIVQREFPKHYFSRIVSVVVAINQFSFAFGPSLLGQLQHARGSYSTALLVCLALEATAAIIVVSPVVVGRSKTAASLAKRCRRIRGRSIRRNV